ncbi:MAG: Ig-like domain-containing protein, partial [Butyrivibrio sp.]|nr:Ig-like domain-containing protein [Butyrivibrio sp.]
PSKSFDKTLDDNMYLRVFYKTKNSSTYESDNSYATTDYDTAQYVELGSLEPSTEYEYIFLISESDISSYSSDILSSDSVLKYVTGTFTTKENITYTKDNFPDDTFRALVMEEAGISSESDLTSANLEKITSISESFSTTDTVAIKDLTGVELLTNLTSLNLRYHDIETIPNISSLNCLEYLYLEGNNLTEMPNLSNNTALSYIDLDENLLNAESVSSDKFPSGYSADIDDIISRQRTNPEFVIADTYYKADSGYPFIIQYKKVKDERNLTLSITVDGSTYTATDSSYYSDYANYITVTSVSNITEACNKKVGIKVTDQTGKEYYNNTAEISFAENKDYAKDTYITSSSTTVQQRIFMNGNFDEANISDILIKDGNTTYSIGYKYLSTYSSGSLQEYEDFFDSNYASSLGIECNRTEISATIQLGKYLNSGTYDLALVYNGNTYNFSDVIHVDTKTVINNIYTNSEYDNTGDYCYLNLSGSNLNFANDNGLNVSLLSSDGKTTYATKSEIISDYSNHLIVKLKMTDDFKNVISKKSGSNIYCSYKISGVNVTDATSSKKTISLYFSSSDLVTFEHYNYKKGYYEVFLQSSVEDGTKATVEIYSSSNYTESNKLASATATVSDNKLELVFTNVSDGSEYKPVQDKYTYFQYKLTFPDGTTSTFSNNATVRWYNYNGSNSPSGTGSYSIYGNNVYVETGSNISFDVTLQVPKTSPYASSEIITATINNVSAVLTRTNYNSTYYIYKGTWKGSITNDGIYSIKYYQGTTTISPSYSCNVYAYDKDVFYQNSQYYSDSGTFSISSNAIYGHYLNDYNSKVSDSQAMDYVKNNLKYQIFDGFGNDITSATKLDKVTWNSSSINLYISGINESYVGVYFRVTDINDKLGIMFGDSEDTTCYANYASQNYYIASEELGLFHSFSSQSISFSGDSYEKHGYYRINFSGIELPITMKFYDPDDLSLISTVVKDKISSGYRFTSSDLKNISNNKVYNLIVTSKDGYSTNTTGYFVPYNTETIAVSGVSLSNKKASVAVSGTLKLTATVSPSNASDQSLTWTSSDESVATVDASGIVTGVSKGTATITVTTSNNKKATCTITVTDGTATNLKLNKTSLSLAYGGEGTLTATINEDALSKTLSWSTDSEDIITITPSDDTLSATISAKASGTTTVTVATTDGSELSATCKVTVAAKKVVKVKTLKFDKSECTIKEGSSMELTPSFTPGNATIDEWTFTSSDESVATVAKTTTDDGIVKCIVTGVKESEDPITITATAITDDGSTDGISTEATISVKVISSTVPPATILMDERNITLRSLESINVNATIVPSDTTTTTINYSVKNIDGNDVSTDVLTAETTETGVKLTAGEVTTTTVAKVIATAAADSNITTSLTVTILASDVAVENDAEKYAEAVENGSDIWVAGLEDSYVYTGTAIKPDIRVYYGTSLLTLNKDYSLKYANNTKVASSTDTKAPSITITFKGSYQNTSKTK